MAKPETAKLAHDEAYRQAVQRTIPTNATPVTVGTSFAQLDLTNYKRKFVWLSASGGNVTILRNGGGALTAGTGLVLKDGADPQEVFVDPGGELMAAVVSSAANTTLLLAYDAE